MATIRESNGHRWVSAAEIASGGQTERGRERERKRGIDMRELKSQALSGKSQARGRNGWFVPLTVEDAWLLASEIAKVVSLCDYSGVAK